MIFIPGNVPSSKNSKQWTGKYLVSSQATQKWRKEIAPLMELNKDKFLQMIAASEPPYHVAFKFVRKSRHKFDYVNPLQSIQDEMVRHGWLEDDNADILVPVLLPYKYNKECPGVYIYVTDSPC